MTTTPTHPISEIVEDLADLSKRRGWERIATGAESLLAEGRPRWLLVAADDGLLGGAAEAVRAVAGAELLELGLEELVADPLRALCHDRVVVLLECGSLLSAEVMEALGATVADRPDGSFALVYGDRGALSDGSDLELFERGVRRWAVTDGASGPLADHGVFLVSAPEAAGFLEERLQADRRRWQLWLQAPEARDPSLRRWQALHLLEHAEAALRAAPGPEALGGTGVERDSAARAARELARGRSLLASRIDSDLDTLERSLVQSLDQAAARAARELRTLLAREPGDLLSEASLARTRGLVESELDSAVATWRREAEGHVEKAEREMLQDLEGLFSVVDWRLVDRLAPGEETPYPAALFEPVEGRLVRELSPAFRADLGRAWSWRPDGESRQRVLIYSTTVAALSAGLLLALRIPLPWIPLISGSAAVGTGWLGQSGLREKAARSAATDVERILQRDVDSARREIRGAVRALRPLLLDPLEKRVRGLEAALERAAEGAKPEGAASAGNEDDTARLRDLRRRAFELEAA